MLVGNPQKAVGQDLCRQGNAQAHRHGKPGDEELKTELWPGGFLEETRTFLDSCIQRNMVVQQSNWDGPFLDMDSARCNIPQPFPVFLS